MECKGAIGSELAMRQRRFNRDIVECKAEQTLRNQQARVPDLIETLWNVKGFIIINLWEKSVDLIETLWNVKIEH